MYQQFGFFVPHGYAGPDDDALSVERDAINPFSAIVAVIAVASIEPVVGTAAMEYVVATVAKQISISVRVVDMVIARSQFHLKRLGVGRQNRAGLGEKTKRQFGKTGGRNTQRRVVGILCDAVPNGHRRDCSCQRGSSSIVGEAGSLNLYRQAGSRGIAEGGAGGIRRRAPNYIVEAVEWLCGQNPESTHLNALRSADLSLGIFAVTRQTSVQTSPVFFFPRFAYTHRFRSPHP